MINYGYDAAERRQNEIKLLKQIIFLNSVKQNCGIFITNAVVFETPASVIEGLK